MNNKSKNSPLTVVTTEQDLANMRKNREKFVKTMGQEEYDRLVKSLEDHIANRPKK